MRSELGKTPDRWAMLNDLALPWVEARYRSEIFQGILDGSLDDQIMRRWIEQDFLYLHVYSRVLGRLAWQAPDHHIKTIVDGAHHTIHREVDQIRDLGVLFNASFDDLTMSPACSGYTSHLLANSEIYDRGIISVMPCMIGFAAMGMTLTRPDEPRYRQWIDTYSDGDFQAYTARFRELVNDLTISDSDATGIFETGMRYELQLWTDAACI